MAERRYTMAVKLKSGQMRSLDKKAEEYSSKFGFTIKRGQALEIMLTELLPEIAAPPKKPKKSGIKANASGEPPVRGNI